MRRTSLLATVVAGALLLSATGCGSGTDQSGSDGHPAADHAGGGQRHQDYGVNPEQDTADEHQSTFALDVDTGSYTYTRGHLQDGLLPDPAAVRTEEFINYFPQDYPIPEEGIAVRVDGTGAPFLSDPAKRVMRVGLQAAAVDDEARQPANLTVIVDTSGSMAGYNLEMVNAGLTALLDALRPDDRVAIVSFSTEATLRLPMTAATEKAQIQQVLDGLEPQDSTNLEAGLRVGYQHARENLRTDGLNRVVLLSDGAANVGQQDPHELAEQIAQEAGRDTQLVVVGVGRQTYDEVVLEQFADNGNGFYSYIDTVREAERLFVHDLTGTLQFVALDAKVQVTFEPDNVTGFRLLGYENRQLDHDEFRDDTVDGGEVGAGHNVTALYELTLPEGGTPDPETLLATVTVRWLEPDTEQPVERSATLTAADLVDTFAQAPDRLRQDILVAAFAECLRDAPWAELVSLEQVADNAEVLAGSLTGDQMVAEFASLTRAAADLSP